jgi:glycolate oxidase FAD binding subunit
MSRRPALLPEGMKLVSLTADMRPDSEAALADIIGQAYATATGLEIVGGGSKRAIGRPTNTAHTVSTRGLRGITLYEPNEMVMSARAGTLVSEVQSMLAKNNQMLAFEPIELAGLAGGDGRQATIGAVFATNASGPRRITAGAARDHLLGIRGVNGRGEIFKNGGRVMKNVTGVDLCKGLAGSWGTLSVFSEVTFKVMPRPQASATGVLLGLSDAIAIEVLCAVMGTPFEVSGAAHVQQSLAVTLDHMALRGAGRSVTTFRLEAPPKSIAYRMEKIRDLLRPYGDMAVLEQPSSEAFWDEMVRLSVFDASDHPIWRISTAPMKGPEVVAAIGRYMPVRALYDWSGGLVWIDVPVTTDAGAADVRRVIASHGGHATLLRAAPSTRAATDVFQTLEPGVERLSQKLKATFDPANILNPGRMYVAF